MLILVVMEERDCVQGVLSKADEIAAHPAIDDPLLSDLTELAVDGEEAHA